MGVYLNPGNGSFTEIRNAIYVDKSSLISYVNSVMNTPQKLTCFSRPRRFGKSFAAKMLCAYYDKSCDSHRLFDDLDIAQDPGYGQYLNNLNVLYLDITWFMSLVPETTDVVSQMQLMIIEELRQTYPDWIDASVTSLQQALLRISQASGVKFFVIIDEWDALFREAKQDTLTQKAYIQLLRGLFKGGVATDQMIAGAYMTGILPIKKYGTESALTDFQEFSMVEPGPLAACVGFSEQEVQRLCETYDLDMNHMRQWYDGYQFASIGHVYSPNSVMSALRNRSFGSYWTQTETYESLKTYISMNMDGLKDDIIAMLGGQRARVNTLRFQNDMTSFRHKSDVLTLLVHLGYLAYDKPTRQTYIPNLEVADNFQLAVEDTGWQEVAFALEESEDLLGRTLAGDSAAVAEALDRIHQSTSSILQYNDENSLSCALTIAYYTARKDYLIVRELPAGKGFADLAFIPRPGSGKSALLLELKYNHEADCAIRQIKEKRYAGQLLQYTDDLLLVGISYDRKGKTHSCIIEKA